MKGRSYNKFRSDEPAANSVPPDPVDDAFCIFLWNSSIKELCCVVRRARCCVISYVVTLFEVTMVRWRRCAISYVVTLFEVTMVRCKTLEGVRAKRKRPKPPLCLPKPPRACRGLSLCAQRDVCRAMRHTLWHSRSAATCRCEARCKSQTLTRSVL